MGRHGGSADRTGPRGPVLLMTCAVVVALAEAAAGAAVATAAAAAAHDWSLHVDAQVRLDRGAITASAADIVWAETKAHGSQDVSRFNLARSAQRKVAGSCKRDLAITYGTPWADTSAFCSARIDALTAVASAGSTVVTQWKQHLDVVGSAAHRVGSLGGAWLSEVRAAQPALAAYDRAVGRWRTAPACPS